MLFFLLSRDISFAEEDQRINKLLGFLSRCPKNYESCPGNCWKRNKNVQRLYHKNGTREPVILNKTRKNLFKIKT